MSLRDDFARDDSGLTLVEVIIYSLLLVVIVMISGSILITSMEGQRDITAMGSATSQGQNVANSIEESVRTASSISAPTADALGQRLVVRTGVFTAAGTATWTCRAWLFASNGKIYTKTSTSAIAAPTALTTAGLSGWLLLAQGVTPAGGTAVTVSSSKVVLNFKVAAGTKGGSPAHIVSAVSRLTLPTTTGTGPTTC